MEPDERLQVHLGDGLRDQLGDDRLTANLPHEYPFDPSYGYDLPGLLEIEPPSPPPGFAEFWRARYAKALAVDTAPALRRSTDSRPGMTVWDVEYCSTEGFGIRGWFLEPDGPVRRGFVVGHGYGGLTRPDFPLPRADAAYFVPCPRGLGRSARAPISSVPRYHVLHDIHLKDRYLIGGCVEDLWTAVTALLDLRPQLAGRVGFLGTSFGAGIGAMALAWDDRVSRAHLDIPSFGHQDLRLRLPTTGSADAVQSFVRKHPHVVDILPFYDAAVAARFIRQPVHLAAALFDPVVPPPGQFAIYRALSGPRSLFVRTAGHFEHADGPAEDRLLLSELDGFFSREGLGHLGVPQLLQPTTRS